MKSCVAFNCRNRSEALFKVIEGHVNFNTLTNGNIWQIMQDVNIVAVVRQKFWSEIND